MIGQRFGRLIVVETAGATRKRELRWRCACDCGAEKTTTGYLLRSGQTRSCGCVQRETASRRNRTHGLSHTRLYNIWANMHSRCGNPAHQQYADYGGRGIVVCDDWADFAPFAAWALANGYHADLTIDRRDNDGSYAPHNCRWATAIEQSRNKRPRKDQKLTDAQVAAIRSDPRGPKAVAAEYGVNAHYVSRIKSGERRAFPTERTT